MGSSPADPARSTQTADSTGVIGALAGAWSVAVAGSVAREGRHLGRAA